MPSVERTAYPRFPRTLTAHELERFYTPTEEEILWARASVRHSQFLLCLLALLKCGQRLGYFPALEAVPQPVLLHLSRCLHLPPGAAFRYERPQMLYRHQQLIRQWLPLRPWHGNPQARRTAVRAAYTAARVMDDAVDIVNATIETLRREGFELPAYSTIDRLTERIHSVVRRRLFRHIEARLSPQRKEELDALLEVEPDERHSRLQRLKLLPRRPTLAHLDLLLKHLEWLESLGEAALALKGLAPLQLRRMAHEAKVLDASELKDYAPEKRHTLILCLLERARTQCRDSLGEMFLRRMNAIHQRAKDELTRIQQQQRERIEQLLGVFEGVLAVLANEPEDQESIRQLRLLLAEQGSIEKLREECAALRAWSDNHHLPLLWKSYRSHRQALLQLTAALAFRSTTTDSSLLQALERIHKPETQRATLLAAEGLDLSFASERWRKLLLRSVGDQRRIDRRSLEVCVFSHLADELRSGDACIEGSESHADHRSQMLPWSECQTRLAGYCAHLQMPASAPEFVAQLRTALTEAAMQADAAFPHNTEVTINAKGEPVLKKIRAREIPSSALLLQAAATQRMPVRNLLDILAHVEHWTQFTRHFAPSSGSDPKLDRAIERYLLTVFAIGCNLGPNQAARHMAGLVSSHTLSFINQRHVTIEKLEASRRELLELYLQMDLPQAWGDGKTIAADGTQYDFSEQNLLAGYHFRYKKMGAVAYRHVSNHYVAYFCHFLPPGIWESVYVIDGLLGAKLSVQPDTVHSDTQGQSTTVFAFTHLLGIKLMPRIRNWKDLIFFRPSAEARYQHLDRLFGETINWALIEAHWQDLMQAALSIQAGTISSSLLLRRLGHYSRQNRLYLAAQEVGRVLRTIYLLDWIGNARLRREVTATTNIIESYNGFAKWLAFGGDGVIAENDPDEQQKRLRYNDLIATAVILHNTVHLTRILRQLEAEGQPVSTQDLSYLSPYQTSSVKRFGDYALDLGKAPEPWVDGGTPPRRGPQCAPVQSVLPFSQEA